MNDVGPTPPPPPQQNSLLRRRSSNPSFSSLSSITATTATSSSSSSSSSCQNDFELISIKPTSYVSLKDILPSGAVNSPRPTMMASFQAQSPGSEISIRNRLVKQAAWAYLQPMSTSPDSATGSFLHRLFGGDNPFASLCRILTRGLDWLLRAIWIRSSR